MWKLGAGVQASARITEARRKAGCWSPVCSTSTLCPRWQQNPSVLYSRLSLLGTKASTKAQITRDFCFLAGPIKDLASSLEEEGGKNIVDNTCTDCGKDPDSSRDVSTLGRENDANFSVRGNCDDILDPTYWGKLKLYKYNSFFLSAFPHLKKKFKRVTWVFFATV